MLLLSILLLLLFSRYYKFFNNWLLSLNHGLISNTLWSDGAKLLSYLVPIFMNFLVLFSLTRDMKYSIWMVYASLAVLFLGMLVYLFSRVTGITLPGMLEIIFVRLNKSFVLLVLFIAGHLARKFLPNSN